MSTGAHKNIDYYGLLNIAKDATTDDIRASYKKLALTYHPDRHVDVDNKLDAQQKFSTITAAYETLSDPSKRSLYDLHGVEGLQSGWELVTRIRDPEELKRAFERQRIKEIELNTRKRLHTKSSFVMRLIGGDLRGVFTGRTTLPEVATFNLNQSVNAPFTKKDTATISAGVNVEKGLASVALGIGWHHKLSMDTSAFTEFSSADNKNISRIGIAHRLGKKTHGAITGSVMGMGAFHQLTLTLEQALGQHAMGSLSFTYGAGAGVRGLLRRSQDNNPLALEIGVGLAGDQEVVISKTKHLSKKSVVRFASKIGNKNFGIEATILRRVSKFTKLGIAVEMGSGGVTLSFCFQRAGQKYSVPVLISPDLTKLSVLGAIICPLLAVSFAKMLLINPAEAKKDKRKREERKRQNLAAISEARRVAEGDVRLMTATVMRKRASEENRGGFVIVEARYGKLDEPIADPDYPPSIDVAIPLQYLVEDSQLILHDGPKTGLLGFYDPRIDESKALLIRYLFKRKLHQVVIGDNEPLQAPLRSHLL